MLPGPFQAPPFPGLPSYIPPVVLWLLLLSAAVGIVIALFRVIIAEPGERTANFLVFLLVIVIVAIVYFALMNGPAIAAWFEKTVVPIFKR